MTSGKEDNRGDRSSRDKCLPDTVGRKADRRLKARQRRDRSVWFGIGMFGMVGWTIALTTLLGLLLGLWMDRTWPGRYSWTLTMFIVGLISGCMNAWYWIRRESRLEDDEEE